MLDVSLKIMTFMWIMSFCLLAGQLLIADAFQIPLVNIHGDSIRSDLITLINIDEFNERTSSIVNGTDGQTDEDGNPIIDRVLNFDISAAFVAWELVQLLTGTYVFNALYMLGVPEIFVTGFIFIYLIFLSRTIVGYVRGL